MHIALGLVVLVATVIAVTAVCKRYDLASPLVLIVVGIVASYLPFVPEVRSGPRWCWWGCCRRCSTRRR